MSNAKKSAIASFLLVSESFVQKLIGLASTLVLARFLVPEDFGIIALATLCIYLAEVLSDTGSQQYILRAEHVDNDVVNTSFTINLIFRVTFSALVVLLAPFIVDYYEDPRLFNIIYVLAGLTVLNCLRNPGLWLLKREQQYGKIVKWGLIAKCLSVAVSITMAIVLQNYWAILLAQLTSAIFFLAVSYYIHTFRPKLVLVNAKRQWRFSMWVMPQSLLGYIRTQFDTLFVSSLFSQSALGSYHTMKYLAYIPCSHVLEPATRPLLVELSKIKNNSSHFATQFNVTLLLVMSLALPITVFLFYYSVIVVDVLLGENWSSFSPLLGVLSLIIPSYLIFHHSNRAVYVYGQTKIAAVYELLSMTLLIAILVTVKFDSVIQFAEAKVWVEAIASITYLIYASTKYNGMGSTFRMLVIHLPVIFSCFFSVFICSKVPSFENSLFALLINGTVFVGTFLTNMAVFLFMLKGTNQEWAYIYNLINRACLPVLKKLALNKEQ